MCTVITVPGVRIPVSPPKIHRNFYRITVDFFLIKYLYSSGGAKVDISFCAEEEKFN